MIDFAKIKHYRQKIRLLLMEKPELRPLQREIDHILRNAGNQHNRCVLLQIKMKENCEKIQKLLEELSNDCRRLK